MALSNSQSLLCWKHVLTNRPKRMQLPTNTHVGRSTGIAFLSGAYMHNSFLANMWMKLLKEQKKYIHLCTHGMNEQNSSVFHSASQPDWRKKFKQQTICATRTIVNTAVPVEELRIYNISKSVQASEFRKIYNLCRLHLKHEARSSRGTLQQRMLV